MSRNSLKSVLNLIDDVKKELTPDQSFENDFKRSMELQARKNSKKPSMTYKPSSMNCIRNMYYQVTGVDPDEQDPSYVFIGICNQGSDIHERVQQSIIDMKGNNIDCRYIDVDEFIKQRNIKNVKVVNKVGMETKLRHTELNMSFMCDGIISYKGHYYILEIKTETSNKFFSRKSVDPKHYNQATAYSLALGLNKVLFMYVNRDIFDIRCFLFEVTDEMRVGLTESIYECDKFVQLKQVPPKPVIDKRNCQYCAYINRCGNDGLEVSDG